MVTTNIRLITFDLDDTLWDPRPALEAGEIAQSLYLRSRFPSLELNKVPSKLLSNIRQSLLVEQPELAHRISLFRESFIKRLLQSQGVPDNESKVAANEAFAAFLAHRHEVAIFANAEEALTSLSRRYKIGALTNGNADVRKTGIGKYFNFAWRAEEYGVSKPDPAFFQTAFAQVGVEPHEVIHVGDCHQNDVFGAAEAGAKAIWFKPEGGTSDIASKVVKRLSDLPDAIEQIVSLAECNQLR